ncbi:MAG: response regulator [Treponema sp.]|nr:response regulator [Treponema sp.]
MKKEKIILAIDDNLVQLQAYQEYLESKYDIRTVNSASGAIKTLSKIKADVILMDIEMPEASGFELLDEIRKIPDQLNIPVIIISGNSGQDFIEKAGQTSAFDVLVKPVNKDLLIKTIERALA